MKDEISTGGRWKGITFLFALLLYLYIVAIQRKVKSALVVKAIERVGINRYKKGKNICGTWNNNLFLFFQQ